MNCQIGPDGNIEKVYAVGDQGSYPKAVQTVDEDTVVSLSGINDPNLYIWTRGEGRWTKKQVGLIGEGDNMHVVNKDLIIIVIINMVTAQFWLLQETDKVNMLNGR